MPMPTHLKTMGIAVPEEELSLIDPIGTVDAGEAPAIDAEEVIDSLLRDDRNCWSYGASDISFNPYFDIYYTFEFDDAHIFDIGWTLYVPTEDEGLNPYWYFNGIRYGDKDNMFYEPGESGPDFIIVEDPADSGSVIGDYIVDVDDTRYVMTISEA